MAFRKIKFRQSVISLKSISSIYIYIDRSVLQYAIYSSISLVKVHYVFRDLNPLHDVINQQNYKEKYYKHLIQLGVKYTEVSIDCSRKQSRIILKCSYTTYLATI